MDDNLAGRLPDAGTVAAADARARHWKSPLPGRLKPGSPEHKQAMCAMFAETFNPYKPSVINWPKLDEEALHRITSLPIWDIAVQTEGKARLRMSAYAETLKDPELRETIARNGWEENRHKEVLSRLVEAYGIPLAPEPEYVKPKDTEWAYLVTGFSECVDSFFAFGLFEMARQSGFFPEELVETFEPVMQEECRHILLFANWLAWHRATMPLWRRPWFEMRVWAVWVFLGWERIGLAKTVDGDGKERTQDNNFTVTGGKAMTAKEYTMAEIMDLCLAENDRRFAGYDERLLRPTTMPWLVRLARRFMRAPKPA
ncbi:ferritin-like domain-containing protein [Roseococcus sp. SDR]|uniref:ferritin-like domain-containing protein n=1 Tax=Roseococcus sp. SDR TaxID=2835532 RepID=UPI001BCEFA33|nr:ferritin-like domain-containing protein [Roseococcus sp. SDR]MBV1847305.1 ferritin-like domain-containing protein [Roseococcus sp. SDR]